MKISRRALRMQRHHQRGKRRADLNLIPLIDVFTVLVFFLLVHPNDGAMLPTVQKLHLPESVAEADPKRTLVITVTDRDILLQGRPRRAGCRRAGRCGGKYLRLADRAGKQH